MLHLFGKPKAVLAKYFNSKSLEIDTEDIADIIFILNNNIYLNMHIDFCARSEKREIEILFSDNSKISLDLRNNLIKIKNFNKTVMKKYLLDKNYYTKNQIKKMISISNSNKNDKWKALNCYTSETQRYPLPRSKQGLFNLLIIKN